ncbi:hypothetical protein ACFQZE_07045 [Paenibacillus sp. GCM10027627]|uniref:hypothetical protein n=1 Tax=unclassified Paenibacillus TaxID=185978 RepID=UPI003628511C
MSNDFWSKHKKYMETGMEFGEALKQVELDTICEYHDTLLEDGRLYESDPEDKYEIRDIEG